MSRPHHFGKLIIGFSLLIGLVSVFVNDVCAEQGIDCVAATKSLEAKRAKLSQYISSLKAFHKEGDWKLVTALNYKIDQLIQEIQQAEEAMDCPERPPV